MTDLSVVIKRANLRGRTVYLRGQEWGGGPYSIDVDWYRPVEIKKLPVWAQHWPDVYRVVRAVVSAFEFDDTAETTTEAYDLLRSMWAAGRDLAARGRHVTEWTILTRIAPKSASIPIRWVTTATDSRGRPTERYGYLPRLLGLGLQIIDQPVRRDRYAVWSIRQDRLVFRSADPEVLVPTGFAFARQDALQAHLRDQLSVRRGR